MRTLLLLAILPAASLSAQCTLFDQTGCSLIYPASTNPSLSTYLNDVEAAFQYTNASIAKMRQPKILLTAQLIPATGSWFSTAVHVFGPAIQQYMGMLKNNAGVSTQDVNIWGTPFACDPHYNAYATGFAPAIAVPCDCGGVGTLAKGAALPAGSGPHCTALSYYDGMFEYASTNGIAIRTGWYPGADEIPSCGLVPASSGGVFTEAQFEECMIPFMQTAMNRYGSAITAVQVLEEPTGGMLLIQPFSVVDTAKFISDAATAVTTIVHGTPIEAAATGISVPNKVNQDAQYWNDWLDASGTGRYLNFLVADIFSGDCDLGSNSSGVPYYASVLNWWQANYLQSAAAYNGGAGKPVRVGQSDPPVWCEMGGGATQYQAILGEGDVLWETSGLQNEWLWTFMHWASAMGIQSATPYCNVWFFNYTSNQQNDSCVQGSWSGLAMSNLSPTPAAVVYEELGAWVNNLSAPVINAQNGVLNGAGFQPDIAAGSWAEIQGTSLSYTTRPWQTSDFVDGTGLPTSLDGVSVTVDGKPAYVAYISPTQINFIVPADSNVGPEGVQVTTTGVVSNTVSAQLQTFSPAFFLWDGQYAAATHLNYTLAASPSVFATATPAMPGETIILWGTGFGPTNPPDIIGQATSGAPAVTTLPTVTIGGVQAEVLGAAMSAGFAGLYQIAVQVPSSLSDGDQPIVAQAGGVQSPASVLLTVQH
jgi:uncharacterized protein (TIGR03437 family)